MKIQDISREEFEVLDRSRKLVVHDHPRRYALLDLNEGGGRFGLCWRSDQIEPLLQTSPDDEILWLGVDQHLVAVELKSGRVRLSMALDTSLLQMVAEKDFIVVLTENEVQVYNWDGPSRMTKGLLDLPDFATFKGGVLTVRLVDGTAVTLEGL